MALVVTGTAERMKQFRISVSSCPNGSSSLSHNFGGSSNFYPPALDAEEQHANNNHSKHFDEDLQGRYHQHLVVHTPQTPRNIQNPATTHAKRGIHYPFVSLSHSNGNGMKQTQPRSFFPDSGPRSCCYMMRKKVQNIDRDMADAVQQVVSMSLDSSTQQPNNTTATTISNFVRAPEVCAFSRYESSSNPMSQRKE